MIITENENVLDSALFYNIAREVIKESIELKDIIVNKKLQDYIINEASNYEVLSLLLTNKFPEKVNDSIVEETLLFSELKEKIIENFEEVSEMVGSDNVKDFIFEVTSLPPDFMLEAYSMLDERGYDTAKKNVKKIKDTVGYDTAKKNVKKIKDTVGYDTAKKNVKKIKNVFTGSKESTGSIVNTLKGIADRFGGTKVGKMLSSKPGVIIGGTVIASLLAYGAVKTYKRFFGKASKACSGKSGTEKTACINAYRVKALQAEISDLKGGLSGCAKSKDPGKCKAIITKRIQKTQAKINNTK